MKRSEINAAIKAMIELADSLNFKLPPFVHWMPEDWADRGKEYDEIRAARLGWDVTDFGSGRFEKTGLTLLTIRNGIHDRPGTKPYCEKLMMVGENQITPMHFHWNKTEDIIVRGGGRLVCKVYEATSDDKLAPSPVRVSVDGRVTEVPAGAEAVLNAGESITLTPRVYHSFWGQPGGGAVLVGEVSAVNDDEHDNRFLEDLPRFPALEEDEQPFRLLCTEYPPAGT